MKPFFRMFQYIFRYKWLVAIALGCSFVYASMNAASVYLIGPFLNKLFLNKPGTVPQPVIPDNAGLLESIKNSMRNYVENYLGNDSPQEILTRLSLLIIGVIFFKNVFSYIQGYVMAYVEQGVVKNLREDLYAAYQRLPLRYFQKRKTGDFISRVISDCNTINNNLNNAFISLMKEPVSMFAILFLMVVISWKLTVFTFLIAPPVSIVIVKIARKLRKTTKRTQAKIAEITSVIEETISGIRVVKAFAMEKFELERFGKANNSYFRSLLTLFRTSRLAPPLTEFLGVCMAVIILWTGGMLVLEKSWLRPEEFIQFLLLLFLLMQSANKLSDVNVKIQVGVAASERVFEIIDQESDVAEPENPLLLNGIFESIRFRNAGFEYEPGQPVLCNINLTVKVGENIAIVGPSGGGKSTLVDLLPRFFDPDTGSVEFDGVDIRKFRLQDIRCLFGIVTQETILFHDTLRANIAYGRPDIPMEEIISAAEAANAHEFITGFRDGYDTIIGDRGTKLSGGQKQRIAIARAILKNPPILIFDEATSALDTDSELKVQSAINSLMKGRTAFVIAHRLSTIQAASRIVVIDKGEIVEEGTHDDLLKDGKLYRKLYDLQFSRFHENPESYNL